MLNITATKPHLNATATAAAAAKKKKNLLKLNA